MRILGLFAVLGVAALLLTQQTFSSGAAHLEQCKYLYTDSEIQDLLDGEGIAVTHNTELRRYPGPRQVLNAAVELNLSPEQTTTITAIYERMRRETIELGQAIVEQERQLDQLISRGGSPDAAQIVVRDVAEKHNRLRDIHLAAHEQVKNHLTSAQLNHYHQLHAHTAGHVH